MITIFNGKITKLGLYALISSILLGSSSGITFYKTGENEKQKLQNILNQTTNNPVQKQTKIKLSENVSITPQQNVSSVTIANSEYDLETFENAGSSSINHNEKPKNTNNSNTTLTRSKHIKLVEYIKSQNGKGINDGQINFILSKVFKYAKQYNINPYLVLAVMNTETHFRHETVSSAGAKGLMQLMPVNFKEFGVDNSIDGNIKGGVMHLARDYYKYDKSIVKTLVCYNAGCGRLKNSAWRGIKETREYIPKVKKNFDKILAL